ncbi:hypothetical protein ACLOJK_018093 [Asimina triloba]
MPAESQSVVSDQQLNEELKRMKTRTNFWEGISIKIEKKKGVVRLFDKNVSEFQLCRSPNQGKIWQRVGVSDA